MTMGITMESTRFPSGRVTLIVMERCRSDGKDLAGDNLSELELSSTCLSYQSLPCALYKT